MNKNKDEYLYMHIHVSMLLTGLRQLIITSNLDINIDPYRKKYNDITKEKEELEKEGRITDYTRWISELQEIENSLNKEYSPLHIVELYLKKINSDISYEEMEELVEKLIDYVEDLKFFYEEEYQKVSDKYGSLEELTLIKCLVLAKENITR